MEHIMNLSNLILAVISGLGLLSSGCIGAADSIEAEEIHVRSIETLSTVGGQGSNGLKASDFQANKTHLWDATAYPLFSVGVVNPNIANSSLLATDGGKDTFEYSIKCSFTDNDDFTHDSRTYTGEGLLDTTNDWSSSLAATVKLDLFSCMIALINAEGTNVDVYLTGENVLAQDEQGDFIYPDAIWQAYLDGTGALKFRVWPLEPIKKECGELTSYWVLHRVCDDPWGDCGVEIMDDLNDCSQVDGNANTVIDSDEAGIWTCNGLPAIQTWLEEDGIEAIYPRCDE
jgi:hypothetical protein